MSVRFPAKAISPARFAPATALVLAALVPCPSLRGGGHAASLLGLPPLCPFHLLTGLPCPGCGMTRALVCALHGQWHDSLAFHPLGILLALGLGIFALELVPRAPRVPTAARDVLLATFVLLLLPVWIARLTGWLPSPPP